MFFKCAFADLKSLKLVTAPAQTFLSEFLLVHVAFLLNLRNITMTRKYTELKICSSLKNTKMLRPLLWSAILCQMLQLETAAYVLTINHTKCTPQWFTQDLR